LVDELLSEVPAREVLTELTPALLEAFAGSGDPDAALSAFDEALARMPASVQLLSILRSNSALRELFGDVLGSAPRLAQVIASPGARARRCDRSVGQPRLRHELRRRSVGARVETFVAQEQSFEDALNRARDFAAEETFHIGLNLLSGLYDFPAAASESDGRKRLGPSLYYVRLTQRLISALTAPTKARRLYEVDMRLRPSGRQGPLAIQFASFKTQPAGRSRELGAYGAYPRPFRRRRCEPWGRAGQNGAGDDWRARRRRNRSCDARHAWAHRQGKR
jgi:glutamine synthetase adenylyltransferase